MPTPLTDEFTNLKSDFASFQRYFQQKISAIETKIRDFESKNPWFPVTPPPSPPEEVENQTRKIVEDLMWENTLSQTELQIRETFKDSHSREKFVRCSLELVLEKDEQYRKMIGHLFGHLLEQNVIHQSNLFNSLASVLLVMENSAAANKDTRVWHAMVQILLPVINAGHLKLTQVHRKVQRILKQEHYREFIRHLTNAIDSFKSASDAAAANSPPLVADMAAVNFHIPDIDNLYETLPFNTGGDDEHDQEYKEAAVAVLVRGLGKTSHSLDESTRLFRRLLDTKQVQDKTSVIQRIVDLGIHEHFQCRKKIGELLVNGLREQLFDTKELETAFCKNIILLQKLIINDNTRNSICEAFADILMPLLLEEKLKFDQVISIISFTTLSEETKIILVWHLEKIINKRGVLGANDSAGSGEGVNPLPVNRYRRYATVRGESFHQLDGNPNTVFQQENRKNSISAATTLNLKENFEKMTTMSASTFVAAGAADAAEPSETHGAYLLRKKKNLLKERTENNGDGGRGDDDDDDDKKTHHARSNSLQQQIGDARAEDEEKTKGETVAVEAAAEPTANNWQPENLPSSAIKEKMEEIIEFLMQSNNLDESVNIIRQTFNECQTDLVFKAAFEYTKERSSEHRVKCGKLIAEAFKHDAKRIGPQIVNTISLELGDFDDSPQLWKNMAEIVCPSIISGLIRFADLRLLPKCFLRTEYCASLLLAIFQQITQQETVKWLQENWKSSEIDLSNFLPSNAIYKFIMKNNLAFILTEEELAYYKQDEIN